MTLLGASLFSTQTILAKLISIPGMVLFFSFRGFFQAWVAKKLGDTLPERMGRLTMNPAKHIDLIGFIMLLLLGFGFGKPIQFDSSVYKHPKRDNAIQILSAPAAGIIIAFFELVVAYILTLIGNNFAFGSSTVYTILVSIFNSAWTISLYLTVFLFLPLPGFDSYRLIVNFLPYNAYRKLYVIEKYSMWIYIGFIVLLQVPVIGNFLQLYLLDYPFMFLSFLIHLPLTLIGLLIPASWKS